ncbi:hypothetical protein B0H11DRAFT_1979897 [Mycena galericulata]|nr:hypothetical protein B0H11DRAFT_1979897 [Mycena galericulata]
MQFVPALRHLPGPRRNIPIYLRVPQRLSPLIRPTLGARKMSNRNKPTTDVLEKIERERKEIYKDWYTTPNPPDSWTTDWDEWFVLDYFEKDADGQRRLDKGFTRAYGIVAHIEPIAYFPADQVDYFLFRAGGRYYRYDDGELHRFDGEFVSIDDFLRRNEECETTVVEKVAGYQYNLDNYW